MTLQSTVPYLLTNCETNNSREELYKALQGRCSRPREVAANMLNAINEVRGEDLFTPARIVNFLKSSKKARNALSRMANGENMDWLPEWLYASPWPAPALTETSGRNNAQLQKYLKQKKQTITTRVKAPSRAPIDSPFENPSDKVISDTSKAVGYAMERGTQRSVTGNDMEALKQPKRLFDGSLDLSGISNLDFGPRNKAARLSLPEKNPDPVAHIPAIMPFSKSSMTTQLAPIKYPIKRTVPEGKVPSIGVPDHGSVSGGSWNECRQLGRVIKHNLTTSPPLPRTMEPDSQTIPTMVPQTDFSFFAPFRFSNELEVALRSHPESQYLMRADSEPVGRASTVFDGDNQE